MVVQKHALERQQLESECDHEIKQYILYSFTKMESIASVAKSKFDRDSAKRFNIAVPVGISEN